MGSPILRPSDILSIIELIYFVPVLVAAVLVCRRHGFSKQLGWFSMVMLACFRIGATATWIAASYHGNVNGLVTASIVLSHFGLASILISLQGLLTRLNVFIPETRRVPPKVFKLVHLLTSAGIALAMAAAIQSSGDSTTTSSHSTTGRDLERVAIIIFVVIYAVLCALGAQSFVYRSRVVDPERPIFKAACIAIPMLAPRLLFALLAAYQVDTRIFNSLSQGDSAVVVSAIFVTLPEFIIAAVILRAGFKVPSLAMQRAQMKQSTTETVEA
ncbi:hypothetical protein H2200_003401 [Cladophialophora chaetospira]|uniref:DUF7702 domain-containing protein n=1 Tax=Cladophialophora chaetospira TaxID=386627 RepID=A0AA39CLD9_9EURO|nr:hypothetical protein H2200_003401 [Cladophialophora chaetospira]